MSMKKCHLNEVEHCTSLLIISISIDSTRKGVKKSLSTYKGIVYGRNRRRQGERALIYANEGMSQ